MTTSELPTRDSLSNAASQEEVRQRVLAIYAEVDAAVRAVGPRCESSGRCCRFKEFGHTLFISQLEADVLLAAAPPFQQPVGEEFCPFQKENLCTAREPRPLGCRIYFCDPGYQQSSYDITEVYLRRLKDLAEEFQTGWRYAPLHVFLNEADSKDSGSNGAEKSARIALQLAVE